MLNTADVFVYDTGYEIWVWVGRGASPNEKKVSFPLSFSLVLETPMNDE